MSPTLTYIDAHCHLADERLRADLPQVLSQAKASGFGQFVQAGLDPADWQHQLEVQRFAATMDLQVFPVFGLHPYTVSSAGMKDDGVDLCDQMLDQLARALGKAVALGEAGLDFRPKYLGEKDQTRELQLDVFGQQLELARLAHKPVVLHLVQAHDEALLILDHWGQGLPGMVHAFNGSDAKAQDFLQRGLHISVGGALCRPDNQRLAQAVAVIPHDKLCLESDSPDQAPPGWQGLNRPVSILQVAQAVARIWRVSADEVLDRTGENTRKLFHLKAP